MTISPNDEEAISINGTDIRSQNDSNIRSQGVYTIFTASGAAGLIYQVIWARWLGIVFGNTTVSISIVLSSFMLGLAIGSWVVGRYLQRIKDPMRLYAYLELSIGVFALCFPLLTGAVDWLFTLVVKNESPLIFSFGLLIPTVFTHKTG